MDVEEVKKNLEKKIEAEKLVKQVRKRIKEYTWQKQDQREGFTETFKPLISQFEKPEDSKTQNLFTQNQKMLQNQLALTEGLRANQKAITDGFSQFERLADMQELPGIEAIEDGKDSEDVKEQSDDEKTQKKSPLYDIEKNFKEEELEILESKFGFPRPNRFFDLDTKTLQEYYEGLMEDRKKIGRKLGGLGKTKVKSEEQKRTIGILSYEQGILGKYKNILNTYLETLNLQVGQGLFSSPQEMLQRFQLLNGSLAAGNNGVIPEYIQLAHGLRNHGFINNTQLNKILRKVI